MRTFNYDGDKISGGVHEEVLKEGFVFPSDEEVQNMSEEEKSFPNEISSLSNDELLNKLSVFTSLYASAAVHEAEYKIKVAALERELEILKGNLFIMSDEDKLEMKRKYRDTDDSVVSLQEKLTVAEAYLVNYTTLRTNYEKYCFLFSRALTVRGEEQRLQ